MLVIALNEKSKEKEHSKNIFIPFFAVTNINR